MIALPQQRYALHMSRQRTYGAALVVLGLAATYAFQPSLRHYFWPAIAWSIFFMSALITLVVLGQLAMVVYHMWMGVTSKEDAELEAENVRLQKEMLNLEPDNPHRSPKKVA
jgi:succinate dehydrogenase hydrophobic anchor subunit